MNPKVDFFFNKATPWQKELSKLRSIILDCNLVEELKWGQPCYVFDKRNIVLIHGFKEYCALLFHKGALLKDDNRILIQQTGNVQAARARRADGDHDMRRARRSGSVECDDWIGEMKLGDPASSEAIWVGLIGDDVDDVAPLRDDGLRIDAGAARHAVAPVSHDTGDARPIVLSGDEADIRPVLRKRQGLDRRVGAWDEGQDGHERTHGERAGGA